MRVKQVDFPQVRIESAEIREFLAQVIRRIGAFLQEDEQVRAIVEANNLELGPFHQIRYGGYDLSAGYAGLCLLYAEMDRMWPEESWDMAGHRVLVRIQNILQVSGFSNISLWGGLTGVAMAVRALSRSDTRYEKFSLEIRRLLLQSLPSVLGEARQHLQTGASMQDYDVIFGLSGVGRYLLLERDREEIRPVLEQVLAYLVELSHEREVEGQRVPGWYMPPSCYQEAYERESYPQGDFNVGVAHGIAGPLALLALARSQEVEVPGQKEAIERITKWLLEWKVEDEYGVFWPARLRFESWLAGEVTERSHREAWCYGSPGVARSIWLAGTALQKEEWKNVAIESFRATFRRPLDRWKLEGPTFCHGWIGLLQLVQSMFVESGIEELRQHRDRLLTMIIESYDPQAPLAFPTRAPAAEGSGRAEVSRHDPGLLMGVTGAALVLLGLLEAPQTEWEAVFLIR